MLGCLSGRKCVRACVECEGVYQYQLVIWDTLLIMEPTRIGAAVDGCFVNVRVCCEAQRHLSLCPSGNVPGCRMRGYLWLRMPLEICWVDRVGSS